MMTMDRFKPNVTVAAVVRSGDRYLLVEEEKGGKRVFNQPAGHLEANESLVDAMRRELWEETGLAIEPQGLIAIYQYQGADALHFLRFTFWAELDGAWPQPAPQDSDIIAGHWLTLDDIQARRSQWRSAMVGRSIDDYLAGIRLPLAAIVQVARHNNDNMASLPEQ